MNSKRLQLIGAILFMLVALIVALAVRSATRKPVSVCVQAIQYIEANDAQKSYTLFTKKAQTITDYGRWQQQLPVLAALYGKLTVPKLMSSPNDTSLTSKAAAVTEKYEVTFNDSSYDITCNLVKNGKIYQIDSFTSQAKL